MREQNFGFHARVIVVLSINIAKNLESQIPGAMRRSDSPHPEVIFHQPGDVGDVVGDVVVVDMAVLYGRMIGK